MKILIVDDLAENTILLESLLEGAGFAAVTAHNGKEALERLREQTVDLIVSDILMPVMDGFQLCQECKNHPEWSEIPFVFYTATYTEKKDEEFALALGADRFVVKPQEPGRFLSIIKEVLELTKTGGRTDDKRPSPEETAYLSMYSERLFRKLEKKVSDLAQMNLTLRESEEKYRLLADNVADVIFVLDMNLNYVYVSPSVKTLRGYEPAEVMEQPASATLTPASWKVAMEHLSDGRALEEAGHPQSPRTIELEVLRRDGSTVWTEMRISFIRDVNNRLNGILGVTRDITERRKAEDLVRESEKRLKEAESIARLGSWELHIPTGQLIWSDEVYHLFGIDPKDFRPSYEAFLDAVHPEDRELIDRTYRDSVNNKTPYEITHRLRMKEGSARVVHERCETFYDAKGNPVRSIGTVQDVTRSKQAEEMLAKAYAKIRAALGSVIDTLVVTLEIRDPYTAGHQKRVADLARAIGEEMGLEGDRLEGLWMAGTIHDVGKISVPAEFLSKPSRLSPVEMAMIQEHSRAGREILKDIEFPWPIADIIHQHHERLDGSGYPRGLKGNEVY